MGKLSWSYTLLLKSITLMHSQLDVSNCLLHDKVNWRSRSKTGDRLCLVPMLHFSDSTAGVDQRRLEVMHVKLQFSSTQ